MINNATNDSLVNWIVLWTLTHPVLLVKTLRLLVQLRNGRSVIDLCPTPTTVSVTQRDVRKSREHIIGLYYSLGLVTAMDQGSGNKCEPVCVAIPVADWVSSCVAPSIFIICFGDHVYLLEVRTYPILNLGMDYTDWTTRVSIITTGLSFLAVANQASKLQQPSQLEGTWKFFRGLVSYLLAIKKCCCINEAKYFLDWTEYIQHYDLTKFIFVSIRGLIYLSIIYFNLWHVHYTVSIRAYGEK